jgi:hypothetical protein
MARGWLGDLVHLRRHSGAGGLAPVLLEVARERRPEMHTVVPVRDGYLLRAVKKYRILVRIRNVGGPWIWVGQGA